MQAAYCIGVSGSYGEEVDEDNLLVGLLASRGDQDCRSADAAKSGQRFVGDKIDRCCADQECVLVHDKVDTGSERILEFFGLWRKPVSALVPSALSPNGFVIRIGLVIDCVRNAVCACW